MDIEKLKIELNDKNRLIRSLEQQLYTQDPKVEIYDEKEIDTLNKNILLILNDHSLNVNIIRSTSILEKN